MRERREKQTTNQQRNTKREEVRDENQEREAETLHVISNRYNLSTVGSFNHRYHFVMSSVQNKLFENVLIRNTFRHLVR